MNKNIYVTYKRKKINYKLYQDPDVNGLIANLPYSNPLNSKQFLAYFEDNDIQKALKIMDANKDFSIEFVDDVNELLTSWYSPKVRVIDDKFIDERESEDNGILQRT